MTVADLIALLSDMPADATIVHRGLDDYGYVHYSHASVVLDDDGDVVVSSAD
jgi:hypothetical protein